VCKLIEDCPGAYEDLLADKTPVGCGFSGFDPIICCVTGNRVKPISKPQISPKPIEQIDQMNPLTLNGRGRVGRVARTSE